MAQRIDTLIPPYPAHVLAGGRGVAALVFAMLDGHHALYQVGRRLAERGMLPLWPRGLERPSVHDPRLGQILDALFAAHLNRVFGAIALTALQTYALGTPWMHQAPTTSALYGAYDQGPEDTTAPCPAYGHSQDGRGELTQVLWSLGGSGDGGLPLRRGLHDGKTRESLDGPARQRGKPRPGAQRRQGDRRR